MSNSKAAPKEDFLDGLLKAMDEGIASGVGNFFSNIWVGAGRFQEDFFGFDDYDYSRVTQNIDDDIRLAKAVVAIADNTEILYQMVMLIIDDTMSQLSFQKKEQIADSILKSSTHFTVASVITGSITAVIVKIISDAIVKKLLMTGLWKILVSWSTKGSLAILPMEALLARASERSRILSIQNPELFKKLFSTGCDMLYFVFKPVVTYIKKY